MGWNWGPAGGEQGHWAEAQSGCDNVSKSEEYLHVWGRAQGSTVGGASANRGEGKYPCAPCILLPPRGAQRPAQGLPEGREEVQHAWAGARLQPRLCVQERRGRDAQVARLSAGRPDTRIWELLLLRMESWVPPFTPLLAREGCRCLKSTAK